MDRVLLWLTRTWACVQVQLPSAHHIDVSCAPMAVLRSTALVAGTLDVQTGQSSSSFKRRSCLIWRHPLDPRVEAPHYFLLYEDESAAVPSVITQLWSDRFSLEPPKSLREGYPFCVRLNLNEREHAQGLHRTSTKREKTKFILSARDAEELEGWKSAFGKVRLVEHARVAYRCAQKLQIHKRIEVASSVVGMLNEGDVIEAIAQEVDIDSGAVRLQFAQGWCTLQQHSHSTDDRNAITPALQKGEEYLNISLGDEDLSERLSTAAQVLLAETAQQTGWLMLQRPGHHRGGRKKRVWMVLWRHPDAEQEADSWLLSFEAPTSTRPQMVCHSL